MKDIPVLKFNLDIDEYEILNDKYLPFQLKGKICKVPDFTEIKTKYDDINRQKIIRNNYRGIEMFLASRVLPITRENAKKIYDLFGFEQNQEDIFKAKIAIICRAVSLQDNYWIKTENDPVVWKDVNLRTNSLSEIVAQVALHGSSLTLQGKVHTPELTGQGAYAKAWIREKDGLYLHKKGSKDDTECKIEVMTSNILDKCNVNHLHYEMSSHMGESTCKCKCMTNDTICMLSGLDFNSYCNSNDLDYYNEIMKIDKDSLYKMFIVDYLISNRDRHGMNWGFFYNCDTMKILGCHPLYDHNNAFDEGLMENKNAKYIFSKSYSIKEMALYAMKRTDFHFTKPILRKDFMTNKQYECFMDRANELGIKLYKEKDSIDSNLLYNYDINEER
jgi:hypothetical protein